MLPIEKGENIIGNTVLSYCGVDDITESIQHMLNSGATIYEVEGSVAPVYVAFNAGNLIKVAIGVKREYPNVSIVVCGDNDQWTDGNPGLTAAKKAAAAVRGVWVVPDFNGLDLSEFPGSYRLRWIDIGAGDWAGEDVIQGGAVARLTAPSDGPWAAAITKD